MIRALGLWFALAVCAGGVASAQMPPSGAQMPDASQMSGVPLPVGDLAPGTITVRVVRGSMANVIAGHPVELQGGPTPLTVTTNSTGRAEFQGLRVGTRVKAVTTVDGERLESQEFEVPQNGGVRLALVATDPEAAKREAQDRALAQGPSQPGMVVLGDQSRFVLEIGEDGLNVFSIMQIMNTARTPVQPPAPLVFPLPQGSTNAAILQGSSPQATLAGNEVTVTGPFAPGATLVQFAYALPLSSAERTIQQVLPAPLGRLTVVAHKVGETHLTSPQIAQHREMQAEGRTYIMAQGPGLQAGEAVVINFTGLPHAPVWPRNMAVGAAVLILLLGAWGSRLTGSAGASAQARRGRLEAERDRLFGELTRLEEQHRLQGIEPDRHAALRRELIAALERVYAELDEEAAA
jgi:hypothetical protein